VQNQSIVMALGVPIVLIDAGCVPPFDEGAAQIRFINSVTLRKRKQMAAIEENSSRAAKRMQTKE
jgi:hypothetical protein